MPTLLCQYAIAEQEIKSVFVEMKNSWWKKEWSSLFGVYCSSEIFENDILLISFDSYRFWNKTNFFKMIQRVQVRRSICIYIMVFQIDEFSITLKPSNSSSYASCPLTVRVSYSSIRTEIFTQWINKDYLDTLNDLFTNSLVDSKSSLRASCIANRYCLKRAKKAPYPKNRRGILASGVRDYVLRSAL